MHIVNPTLMTATAPGSATSTTPGLKRSGHSPHANRTGVRRLCLSPSSMTVPSGVSRSPDNSQRSSPLISTNSAKQSSASASNSASNAANPAASANAAGAVAAAATGSTMSGPGSVGNAPGAAVGAGGAAGPGGRPISPSVHVVPSQNTRGHSGSAPSTNRSPPSQHQYAHSGLVAHRHVHLHSHSQGTPASSHPYHASQLGANANTRDVQPPHSAQLQQHGTRSLLLSWTTSPLCPLASRAVARGNKPADIVINPCNSDAGASLNQSGPGTYKRHCQLVATSLYSP